MAISLHLQEPDDLTFEWDVTHDCLEITRAMPAPFTNDAVYLWLDDAAWVRLAEVVAHRQYSKASITPEAHQCAGCGHLHFHGVRWGYSACPVEGCGCAGQDWAVEHIGAFPQVTT